MINSFQSIVEQLVPLKRRRFRVRQKFFHQSDVVLDLVDQLSCMAREDDYRDLRILIGRKKLNYQCHQSSSPLWGNQAGRLWGSIRTSLRRNYAGCAFPETSIIHRIEDFVLRSNACVAWRAHFRNHLQGCSWQAGLKTWHITAFDFFAFDVARRNTTVWDSLNISNVTDTTASTNIIITFKLQGCKFKQFFLTKNIFFLFHSSFVGLKLCFYYFNILFPSINKLKSSRLINGKHIKS